MDSTGTEQSESTRTLMENENSIFLAPLELHEKFFFFYFNEFVWSISYNLLQSFALAAYPSPFDCRSNLAEREGEGDIPAKRNGANYRKKSFKRFSRY